MSDLDDLDAIRQIVGILEPFEEEDRRRIYRWVGEKLRLLAGDVGSDDNSNLLVEALQVDPRVALRKALQEGNLGQLPELAEKMRELGNMNGFVAAAAALAAAGSKVGANLLLSELNNSGLDEVERRNLFGTLVNYYTLTDQEEPALEPLREAAERFTAAAESDSDKAFYLNQLGRLYFGARRIRDAFAFQERAAELNPEEVAYIYNLALILKEQGRYSEAARYARRIIEMEPLDTDHLRLAIEVLAEAGDVPESIDALQRLLATAPEVATSLIREDRKLRDAFKRMDSLPGWKRE